MWLNEGFASYVEYLGVEAVQPQMKLMEQFVTIDLQSVMRIDALESSHPISIPVGHPDEISEIFDRELFYMTSGRLLIIGPFP